MAGTATQRAAEVELFKHENNTMKDAWMPKGKAPPPPKRRLIIFNGLSITLTGFTFDEIDTVLVKVYDNKKEIDSFQINTDKSTYDSIRQMYTASFTGIHRKININNTFYFYIKGEKKPYILSNMKMIVRACPSMFKMNYCCFMEQFDLDGKTYYEEGPELRKRDQ